MMEHETAARLMDVILWGSLAGLVALIPLQFGWPVIVDCWERRAWYEKVPAWALGIITVLWPLLWVYRCYGYVAWGI